MTYRHRVKHGGSVLCVDLSPGSVPGLKGRPGVLTLAVDFSLTCSMTSHIVELYIGGIYILKSEPPCRFLGLCQFGWLI